ncbi:auxin-induced protein 6B [Pistacia vera]|uniref:auxin-induced protein 6B n=1 Tax=Pistacia vera TaxID=55513 RepID=UPI001263B354|nr:auxin-induced protein 6B [Pistacia vera]
MKLSEMVEKWRKRKKGHFSVYTKEGKRFVVPLYYLNHPIFRVLLEMAEEEFGIIANGPLQVPCEEELMDNILSLLRRNQKKSLPRCRDNLQLHGSFNNLFLSTLSCS